MIWWCAHTPYMKDVCSGSITLFLPMPSVTIVPRSRAIKALSENVPESIAELVAKVGALNRLNTNRVRLTIKQGEKHVSLDSSKSLSDYFSGAELKAGVKIYAKDMGYQIAWKTVFLMEYFGPIAISLVAFGYFTLVKKVPQSQTQKIALAIFILHFLKREYESAFVHKFSLATMPVTSVIKNSSHYWLWSGVVMSTCMYSHDAATPLVGTLSKFLFHVNDFPTWVNAALVGAWALCELGNLNAHITLANLRTGDSKAYHIPYGFGFQWVTCPNYFFESLGWVFYSLLVGNWSAWVFLIVGSVQMYFWALKRHQRLLHIFGDDYKKLGRTLMYPFLK